MDDQPQVITPSEQQPSQEAPSVQNVQPFVAQSPPTIVQTQKNSKRTLLFGLIGIIIFLGSLYGVYAWQHGQVDTLNKEVKTLKIKVIDLNTQLDSGSDGTVPGNSIYEGGQEKARNSKRQVDMSSLQTQLEAFFSQNGYYPSLADMNSTSWLNTNMKSLDQNSLTDPSSPNETKKLASSPTAKQYSYQPTTASGASCEADDTTCAKYTLTATFEGQVGGATTYVKNSLD